MTAPARFDTVLVANRGEIALRVLRTARLLGYRTVAVYSDADRGAPHVRAADTAVRLGPAPARDSYLAAERIVAAAQAAGAEAIHPGYGFLAESAAFARAVEQARLVFIGPPADVIALMGDKAAAKRRLAAAGIPLLDGYHGQDQARSRFAEEAVRIGFPVMVKAAAGGGGKGMRLVMAASDLPGALDAAGREAEAAFGDATLLLERAWLHPRHVEVQVLADEHGQVVAVGERDCSVQRRHQKVIEETPCPALDLETRSALLEAAVDVARAIGYVGAGTVEFLLEDGAFAFLEMNTRLQVEHAVTELVTGLDLVAEQLRIAQGERLAVAPDQPRVGHAIEARLYAEDPARGYLPQSGRIVAWRPPRGAGIRVDAGVEAGMEVTAHYDPLLAKIVAHGRDRDEARRRLEAALARTVALGVTTNRAWLGAILRHPAFAAGEATTAFLADHDVAVAAPDSRELAAAAAWLHLGRTAAADDRSPGLAGWTNAATLTTRQRLTVGDNTAAVTLSQTRDRLEAALDDDVFAVGPHPAGVELDGIVETFEGHLLEGRALLAFPTCDLDVADVSLVAARAGPVAGAGILTAPMHGSVAAVAAAPGTHVDPGDPVVVVEAMKMEHVVAADITGRVSEVVGVGSQVGTGEVVARIRTGADNASGTDADNARGNNGRATTGAAS